MSTVTTTDRLAIRQRPGGCPVMHQTWERLLFLHWPVPIESLRPLIPPPLEIDTFEGVAWIGVTPFTLRGLRPPFFPPLPLVSRAHEINVRTYVHLEGVPGIWFLSLDASNLLAVWGARAGFALPYYLATIEFEEGGHRRFHSKRSHSRAAAAEFEAEWSLGERIAEPAPESLDFYMVERYCLYARRGEMLYQARIDHPPWDLCAAEVTCLATTMIESHGLPTPSGLPVVHAQAQPLHVEIWPLHRVARL